MCTFPHEIVDENFSPNLMCVVLCHQSINVPVNLTNIFISNGKINSMKGNDDSRLVIIFHISFIFQDGKTSLVKKIIFFFFCYWHYNKPLVLFSACIPRILKKKRNYIILLINKELTVVQWHNTNFHLSSIRCT